MQNNPSFTLLVVGQLLRALLASTQPTPEAMLTMPVPADNVTVAGLESDVQMIYQQEHATTDYIGPVNPDGIVAPTSTVEASTTRQFIDTGSMYSVFSQ